MPRLVLRPNLPSVTRRVLAGGVLAGLIACMNDSPLATADATAGLRLSANVVSSAAGRTIELSVMYRRTSSETVRVPAQPERISLEPGTTVQQAVTVDLASCLRDNTRAPANTPGCRLTVELRLLDDAGNTVDVQTKEAPGAPTSPGQIVELGNVTIGIQVGSVAVDPTSVRLTVAQTQQLAAIVKDASGTTLGNTTVTWTSSDVSVAQLSAATGAGVTVTALKVGSANITASSGGKTSPSIPVTVVAPDPLTVTPASASVEVGGTLQLAVVNPPGPVTWQSSDQAVASVDQNGLVRGVQARENSPVTITATSGSGPTQQSGTARITVTSAPPLVISQQPGPGCVIVGQTVTLAVASPPAAVTWTSDDAAVATVDPNTGVVTGRVAGQATIRATSANRSGSAPICVVGPLGNVPPTLTITAGQTLQLSPSGASNATVSYTSDNTGVATVSSSGLVTAHGVGQARITATLTAASGSQPVTTVVTVNAASITIAPSPASVAVGARQALTATARDANGGPLGGVSFAWTVDNPGTVQLLGTSGNPVEIQGLTLGVASVRVTGGGASGAVQVTVTRGAPASITVTLTTANLTIGQTTTATAEVKDAAGNVLTDQTVSWASSSAAVATVTSTGARTATVAAVGAGSANITASIGAISGQATVDVGLVPVATVTLTPTSASLAVGGAGQVLTAVPRDAQGNVLVGRTVTWQVTTGDPTVVQLSATSSTSTATGATVTVTGAKPGSVTVTATSGGQSATSQITVTPGAPASITVTLTTASLTVGQTTTATAEVKDAAGNVVTDQTVSWASSSAAVATVAGTGARTATVTAVSVGSADITASLGGVSSQATVQVSPVPVASVTLAPPSATIAVGGAGQVLTAVPRDAQGNVLVGRTVTWQVTAGDPTVVQLSATSSTSTATGATITVTGAKPGGPVTITATSGGQSATSQITVTPGAPASITVTLTTASLTIGQTTTATAEVKDAAGNVVTDQTVSWASSSAAVATVGGTGARTATVTAVSAGSADITASLGGVSGQATVQVSPVPVASVTLTPPSATIAVGGAGQVLTAVPRDAQGNALVGRTVTWQVTAGDPTVVQLSATSSTSTATGATITVTGAKPGGPVTITATSGGQSATSQITVTPGAPASITVTLTTASLTIGQTTTATAEVKDAAGNVVTDQTVSWASSSAAVATVAGTGARTATVTAVSAGSADITASLGGVSGHATVQVGLVPVASVTLTPTSASITIGGAQVLTAVPRDAQGNALVGRTVTWQVTAGDPTVVQLSATSSISSANGATVTVTGAKVGGPITVTAASGGQTATSQITVTPGPPASIAVAPTSVGLSVGQSSALTATVQDTQGNTLTTLPGGLTVSWESSSASVASVAPISGQPFQATVTALAPGTTAVTATIVMEGAILVSNAVEVTVSSPAPANIEKISGDNSICPVGTFDCSFTVRVTNANSQPLSGVAVDWSWPSGCGDGLPVTTNTNAQGLATLGNCSYTDPGVYQQVATVQGTAISTTFSYTQSGLVVTDAGVQVGEPEPGQSTFLWDVTAVGVVASGLSVDVNQLGEGPHITVVSAAFSPTTTTPSTLNLVLCTCGLETGASGTMEITIGSTTAGVASVTIELSWVITETSGMVARVTRVRGADPVAGRTASHLTRRSGTASGAGVRPKPAPNP